MRGRGFDQKTLEINKNHASWILEFLLQQSIPEYLVKEVLVELLMLLPDDIDPNLKKTILLCCIHFNLANHHLSEEVLLSMDLIEETDWSLGEDNDEPSSLAISVAYYTMAVEWDVIALRREGDEGFFEEARRTWVHRVANLEQSMVAQRLRLEQLSE